MIAHILDVKNLPQPFSVKLKNIRRDIGWLFYRGNLDLLNQCLVAIVGSRHPNPYTKTYTTQLARRLASIGAVIVSGGAMGVDMLAHIGAGSRTIMVSPCGLGRYYPACHRKEIERIAHDGLLISEYDLDFMPQKWTFLERNELIVAMSDCVVIPQADHKSGSIQSAQLAHKMGKPLFVFSHRMGESLGTQSLLDNKQALCIVSLDSFIRHLCEYFKNIFTLQEKSLSADTCSDVFLEFCRTSPLEIEVVEKFGLQKFQEEQLNGSIDVNQGRVVVLE